MTQIIQSHIQLTNVWFRYDAQQVSREHWPLQDINVTIFPGEYVAVMGPNGSGKSTFARLLNGIFTPVEGMVQVGGLNTMDEEERFQIRRRVGMVFQNPDNQIVGTTVRDDVAFGLENLGIPREEMVIRINESLAQVGLTGLDNREPHQLSGGQKQRLAIAGVIAMQPEIVVFDESTSMLDPQGRLEVLSMMKQIHQQGRTVIHITHSAKEAFLADRVIVLANHQVQLDCPSGELYGKSQILSEWGLEVPLAIRLREYLQSRGWELSNEVANSDELVKQLWRSLSIK